MKLTIVIPALNEEKAIGSIIERSLAARETIVRKSPVDDVELIVVSDGSTDRTAEVAAGYDDVRVIVFEKNRGYGAAIKRGFEEGSGDLIGFLDADGTCDPDFFAVLGTALIKENAAVALGSRMGPESRMPKIRRLGNRIYALILSVLSNRVVTDTASGMRVIRRDALHRLYPLPDGLHFTPAMSARVLMDDRLGIVERPMPYQERIGESKLRVIVDGVRFLRTIFEMMLMWRPAKLFVSTAALCLALMVLLAMHPIEMRLRLGRLEEDMTYRLLFCWLLGAVGVTLLSAAVVSDHLHRLIDDRQRGRTFLWSLLDKAYSFKGLGLVMVPAVPMLVWLVGRGVWTWTTAGYVEEHWSRVVLAGLIAFGAAQMFVTVLIVNLLRFHTARKSLRESERAAVSVTAATKTLDVAKPVRPSTPQEDELLAPSR
ncbi:MAG: glycosyltransferase family 2 protein [Phycisphaerales bacterium]|nr:MAG: glycosyltransferase family 2 protein [Phycisphaerales bacterium]